MLAPFGLNSSLLGDLGFALQVVVIVPHSVLPVSWGGVVPLYLISVALCCFVVHLHLCFQGVQLCSCSINLHMVCRG